VDPDATQAQIKSAYRRRAKQSHPDHQGGSCKPFRDVQEAYEVLSDPARRRTHDGELAHEARPQPPPRDLSSEPFRSGRCPVEPLIPTERSSGLEEMFFDRFFHAPQTETLGRLWSDLDRLVRPQVEGRGDLQVDVPLTREKAMRGGRVRVWIPLATTCPSCRGYGHVGAYGCWECSGEGSIVEQRPVWISFPAGISHNTVARVSLAPLGAPHTYLSVRFSVGRQRRVTIL
jgi:DnaJ-class molecular chaperone